MQPHSLCNSPLRTSQYLLVMGMQRIEYQQAAQTEYGRDARLTIGHSWLQQAELASTAAADAILIAAMTAVLLSCKVHAASAHMQTNKDTVSCPIRRGALEKV